MADDGRLGRLFEGVTWVWVDLDDTLIDFRTNSRAALREIYHTEGLDRFWAAPETWIAAYEACNHMLWDRYARAEITQDFLRLHRFTLPLSNAWTGTPKELEEFARRLDPLYLDTLARQKALVPGARELLERLRAREYNIGVLSNGFREVQHCKLEVTGIDRMVDLVVLSDDIGVNKPDRRLYEYAMARAADPTPAHHLMIGDNPTTDIAGAVGAGWRAILLGPAEGFVATAERARVEALSGLFGAF